MNHNPKTLSSSVLRDLPDVHTGTSSQAKLGFSDGNLNYKKGVKWTDVPQHSCDGKKTHRRVEELRTARSEE